MRNPNGYGSITKLKGNRRRPYMVRVTEGWDADGKQIRKIVGYYKTKTEAQIALANYHQNPLSPKAEMTLGEVYKEWSETKFRRLSKSSIDGYKASWKYLEKYKDEPFRELRTSHFQKIIDDNEHMSLSTLSKIKALGTSLYDYAMANDIVDKNYMEFVELPEKKKKKKEVFTDLEIKKMWDCVDRVPWIDTVLIMIYTGMRVGEMLKLTKFSVDIKNKIITGGIKTDAGKDRIIPIHPKIWPLIKRRYDTEYEYLITYEDGSKATVNHYRRAKYYPALEAAGVRKLTPHACRHTFATRLKEAGADNVAIKDLIGHSDYAFTANNYTHVDIENLRNELEKIV